MGLFFKRDGMSREAGEWAAIAMACMTFADGTSKEEEIVAARRQAASNPVIKKSIGAERARELFDEAVQAIFEVPEAMLHSYEGKLQLLAAEIKNLEEKNFAFTTVIAVAKGDLEITEAEAAMLGRFKEALEATIPVPEVGATVAAAMRQAAQVSPESAPSEADRVVMCEACGKLTTHFEKYGFWCAACERYTESEEEGAEAEAPEGAETDSNHPTAEHEALKIESDASEVRCPKCGEAATFYEGYGHWCTPCQEYAQPEAPNEV